MKSDGDASLQMVARPPERIARLTDNYGNFFFENIVAILVCPHKVRVSHAGGCLTG